MAEPDLAGAAPGRPAIFFDRDGVLNRLLPGDYVTDWRRFEWLPRAREALRAAHTAGWLCIVVTNQAGVGRGRQTQDGLDGIHARMCAEAAAAGGRIDAVYACPHVPEDGCDCRKPRPGMIVRAAREMEVDLGRSWLIGDSPTDLQAAEAAGVRWLWLRDGPDPQTPPERMCTDVFAAVAQIGLPPGPHAGLRPSSDSGWGGPGIGGRRG